MKANPVGWFEIPVSDFDRAKAFYENVFECELDVHQMGPAKMAWFPWDQDSMGCTGTLIKTEGYAPSTVGTIVYFTAPDIEAHLARVEASGGRTLVPKMTIGEHGWIAHFEDCEGNRVALHAREG
ncbi:MAG: VOC family protein [Saprospiraceae bacterium]|nr:VOC family protein [Saprospiraceae bacterium]